MSAQIFGWYDNAMQRADQPTFDPPLDAACPICGRPITEEDVRTHSMMRPGEPRSYFYRTHRTCAEQCGNLVCDDMIWNAIDAAFPQRSA